MPTEKERSATVHEDFCRGGHGQGEEERRWSRRNQLEGHRKFLFKLQRKDPSEVLRNEFKKNHRASLNGLVSCIKSTSALIYFAGVND